MGFVRPRGYQARVDADFSGLKNLHEKFSSSNLQGCKFFGSDMHLATERFVHESYNILQNVCNVSGTIGNIYCPLNSLVQGGF